MRPNEKDSPKKGKNPETNDNNTLANNKKFKLNFNNLGVIR